MKLSELLVCIGILLLLSLSFSEALIYAGRSSMKIYEESTLSERLLQTDYRIRTKINSLKIPYWKNADKELKDVRNDFIRMNFSEGIEILECMDKRKPSGKLEGMVIRWRFKGNVYETGENFYFEGIIE